MVFNRFWRADPARARTSGGTGLGLSISLEDTHLHGGWLQAWGRPGQGAQFRLTLPRRAGVGAAAEPAAAGARRRRGDRRVTRAADAGVLAVLAVAVPLALLAVSGCVRMPDERPGGRDRAPAARLDVDSPDLHRPAAAAARGLGRRRSSRASWTR